jgi:hypothetical protein
MRLAVRVPVAPLVTSTAVFAFGDARFPPLSTWSCEPPGTGSGIPLVPD